MTDSTNDQPIASNKPSHIANMVRDREGKRGEFIPLGAAWPHKDGKGFTAQIDAMPLDGRIVFRVLSVKKD